MAKNFPFFKFVATEWLTGDIVYESLEIQGLYINICALYWQRDGAITVSDLQKRYKRPDLIDELSKNFFSVIGDDISIKFLDEQLQAAKHISVTNKKNGESGGRPISVKDGEKRFYVLRCFGGNEVFYKVGITSYTVSKRYSTAKGESGKIPYKFDIAYEAIYPFDMALNLETYICENLKKYTPKLNFRGHNECIDISEDIYKTIEFITKKPNGLFSLSQGKAKKSKEEEEEKENNNKNKIKDIKLRKLKFSDTLKPFLPTYGKDFLNDFFKYWTEENKSGTKFRQELERTWSLDRRLETWARNDKKFSNLPVGKSKTENLINVSNSVKQAFENEQD